jgi:DNA-binding CsgD family transcriptional regulator
MLTAMPVGTISDSGMGVGGYLTVAAGGFLPHRKGPLIFAVDGLMPRLRRLRIPDDRGCPERDTVRMGNAGNGVSRGFAGRVLERRRLADALSGSAKGQPLAVLVHGEAGVGKTRLVREVTEVYRAGGGEVLWGTCVHFGAASVPFAPVVQALNHWAQEVDRGVRSSVLEGADELSKLLPSMGIGSPDVPASRLLPVVDTVVQRIATGQPTVLVIDDLQWADVSSLDVLAYLITGFRAQNLALVVTIREEDRLVGHPLHGWLADVRRLPGVTELVLARLDPAECTDQIAALLGRHPGDDLVGDVLARSGGNAYFTELLVRDLPADAQRLPAELPTALREALLARWHSLPAPARQVTQLLAVGGRPTSLETLGAVTAGVFQAAGLPALVRQAVVAGVLQQVGEQTCWFRHPLLAEVLLGTLTSQERAPVHAAYAQALEASATNRPDLAGALSADLAVHHERAGRFDRAFVYSIRAADYAHELHASSVEAAHLTRACQVWERAGHEVTGSTQDRIALLLRTSRVGEQAGVLETARFLDQALSLVDRHHEPLLASTMLVEWCWSMSWGNSRSLDDQSPRVRPELLEAVERTRPFPDSPERAVALAWLVEARLWDLHTPQLPAEIWGQVQEAVEVARRSDSAAAKARALFSGAQYLFWDYRPLEALREAEASYRLASEAGRADIMGDAAVTQVEALRVLGRTAEIADLGRTVSKELLALGNTQWGWVLAVRAAEALFDLGHWAESDDLIRKVLAARRGGIAGAQVRLSAARFAARQGQAAIAQQHLDRALELVAIDQVGVWGRETEMQLLVGRGEMARAWELFRPLLRKYLAEGDWDTDEILLWGARAAADLAEQARDRRDQDGEKDAIHQLDQLLAMVEATPLARPGLSAQDDPIWTTHRAVSVAETGRCRGTPGQAASWERAASSCSAIGLRWHEAMCRWRWAQALVSEGATRSAVAGPLRQAHSLAIQMGAAPLVEETESLALVARINLTEPGPTAQSSGQHSVLATLTTREREVLSHLVAGRTNAEIARDLFISDKTVSVHVTNVLRKTRTPNRIEAASLALRLGFK